MFNNVKFYIIIYIMTLVYRVKDNNSIENNIDNKLQNRNILIKDVLQN